jgi:hypothetical protein
LQRLTTSAFCGADNLSRSKLQDAMRRFDGFAEDAALHVLM